MDGRSGDFILCPMPAGFRKGRETKDQVTKLRIKMQKAANHQQPVYMCFVDFKKAFDSVSHKKLWISMLEIGYPPHIVDLLVIIRKAESRGSSCRDNNMVSCTKRSSARLCPVILPF